MQYFESMTCHFGEQKGIILNNKKLIVLITGGSQGLGLELVKILQRKCCTVIIIDIIKPANNILSYKNIFFYSCDISNLFQIQKLHIIIKHRHGPVTILINNAGIQKLSSLKDMENEDIDKIMKVNLFGTYLITSTFLNDFLFQSQGMIINVASILGCISPARLSTYCASKGGQIAFHKCVTNYIKEVNKQNNIKLTTLLVCTGRINTLLFKDVNTPSHILAPDICPTKLAKQIIHIIETGDANNLKVPYYTNLISVINNLNWPYRKIIKNISGMNNSTLI